MCILSLLYGSPLFINMLKKKALILRLATIQQDSSQNSYVTECSHIFNSHVLQDWWFWEPYEQIMLHICEVYEGHFDGCSSLLCTPCCSSGSNLLSGYEGDALPHSRLPAQPPQRKRRACQSSRSALRYEIPHVFFVASHNIIQLSERASKWAGWVGLGTCHVRC